MEPVDRVTGRAVVLPIDNLDTDQIIPARFLKVTDRSGLADGLFANWRYDANGDPRPGFPLNEPSARGATVLITGHNFGCGSSREHAAWALLAAGFRVVISTRFADIFRNNALGNGLLPVAVTEEEHALLCQLIRLAPAASITVDLEAQTITLPDGSRAQFPIEPFDKHCLLRALDRLGFLLAADAEISRFEATTTVGAPLAAEAAR